MGSILLLTPFSLLFTHFSSDIVQAPAPAAGPSCRKRHRKILLTLLLAALLPRASPEPPSIFPADIRFRTRQLFASDSLRD